MQDDLRSSDPGPKRSGSGSVSEAWRDLSRFVANSRSINDIGIPASPEEHVDRGRGASDRGG